MKLYQQLLKYSKKSYFLVFGLGTIAFLLNFHLWINPAIIRSCKHGMLDTLTFVPYQTFLESFLSYTSETRYLYYIALTFDMIFPIFYTGLIMISIVFLLKKVNRIKLSYLLYIPLAAMIFDYIENMGILFNLSFYKTPVNLILHGTHIATNIKAIFLIISIFIIIVFCLEIIKLRFFKNRSVIK